MHEMLTDSRLALRSLAKNPGFAVVALLTIALGVGANTAVFSVVNALLLQPLPFPNGDRLVAMYETVRRTTVERRAVSYPNMVDWQRELQGVDGITAAAFGRFTILVGNTPERLDGELVSARYFDVLGVRPLLGRGFSPQDDLQGAAAVVVISDGLWERAFGRDRTVVGRVVTVEGEPSTIVGVMPPGFGGYNDTAQVWAPIARFTDAETLKSRGDRWMDIAIGRLRPGTTIDQLGAELGALAVRLEEAHLANQGRGAAVAPLREEYFGDMRPMLLVLLGAVGFVLLIACVNVANLLLARGSARQREIAVRSALGAQRGRIVRQLLTESIVLSVLGGAAGLLAAAWSIDVLVALSPVALPSFVEIGVDLRVLGFTFLVCIASGLVFGVLPALAVSRSDLVTTLKAGGRDGAEAGSTLLRRGLVTAEIALALVLLVGAGLMLRTLERVNTFDPGFRPGGLVTARVALPADAGDNADAAAVKSAIFSQNLLTRVRELPAVTAASLATDVPLGTSTSATMVRIEGRDTEPVRVFRHAVTPGHFVTLGVPLLEGRDFTPSDTRTAGQRVVIVSRTMAHRHWPGESALHKRLRMGGDTYEVVGIVGDVQHRELLEADTADPDIYLPLFQLPTRAFCVLLRTPGDPQAVVSALRSAVAQLNPTVPIYAVQTAEELVAQQTSRVRFSSVLLGAFALVALTLTMVGIYGVTAYTVSRQTRQVGIRMALGATRGDVLRLILGGGFTLIAAGLVAGTLAALALTRLLSSLIYGVSATDPATFGGVTLLLAVVAFVACLIPAARATRIDPVSALRSE